MVFVPLTGCSSLWWEGCLSQRSPLPIKLCAVGELPPTTPAPYTRLCRVFPAGAELGEPCCGRLRLRASYIKVFPRLSTGKRRGGRGWRMKELGSWACLPFRSCPLSRSLWLEGLQEQGEALGTSPPSPYRVPPQGQLPDSLLRTWLATWGLFPCRACENPPWRKKGTFLY